jgi:Ca2+-transporting ATPase
LLAGLLCNDTQLVTEDGRLKVQGDPTEAALIVAAQKVGHAHEETHRNTPRLDVIPFESEHMFMATLHEGSPRVIYKKGSTERLIGRCDRPSPAATPTRARTRWTMNTSPAASPFSGSRA